MPILDQLPLSITAFTAVGILALCAIKIIYGQGPLNRLDPTPKRVSSKAGNSRVIDKDKSK